ncbi:MAG: ATP-binding cassette domain-containing protein, partial [Myxococcales bacterium]|nr:ATP-binding cassette domain-containing protein [Myxococcales bacterium]
PYLRRNLGIVFQDLRLLASGGVEENIRMAVEAQGVRRGEARARARVYLELLGLGELRREKIFRLSSDVAQRVAIARAMAAQPAILLADEPTSALDTRYTHLVLDLLARLAERGTTVLMVSRNPLVAGYARVGRVMHLADGRLDPEKTRTVIHEYSADALPRIDAALWTGSAAGGPA